MAKILHSADWHLGAYVGPQCDDPMKRMENAIKCLDVLVETARAEQPDIILVAGDLFHSSRIWNDRAMQEFRVAIDYLSALGRVAPVMVLFGTLNHDPIQSFYALEEHYTGSKYPYVRFFTQPEIATIETKSGPIQIAGLPGFDKGHFRAQFPGLSAEEENQVFTQQLSTIVQGLSAQLDPTIPSVLMAHHTVVGCELDNGQHVFQANEVVLDAATLDNSAFDLVCLGHIHKEQRVESCYKPAFYSGSLDAFTFNDEGTTKGFWLHDMGTFQSPITYEHKFIETPAREFFTERWNQIAFEDYSNDGLMDSLMPRDLYKNKVVRILYTCDSETEKALDKKKLERDLYAAGAYYVSEIRPEKVTASVNKDRMTEKLTVSDCLERYLKEKGKTELEISQLMYEAVDIVAEASANSPIGTTSGLFLPVEIEVRNYRSYAEEKFSFEDIFFAMVNGKNGSGKSSLFMDAITDCLYEETRENELTGWIRNGEKSGSISFTFKLGDDTWRVTRTRQRSGKATLALAKKDWKEPLPPTGTYDKQWENFDMIWQDHSSERLADTQQKIKDLLGMDCDTFQSCVLIMQDRYGKFMEASKDDRMAVLANLLGLGIYDELLKITKEKLTDANREVRTQKAEIEALEIEVAGEESLHTELAQVETELAVSKDDLQERKNSLTELQSKIGAMAGYEQEAARLNTDLKSTTDQYTAKKDRKADLERRVEETNSFLLGEQSILDKCAELDKARLDIAALDGKVQLLNDKQLQCGKTQREINNIHLQRNSIEIRLEGIKRNLADRSRLEGIVNGNTVEQELEEVLKKEAEFKTLDTQRQIVIQKRSSLLKQTEMLKDAQCIDIEKAQCKFLKSAVAAKEALDIAIEELSQLNIAIDEVGYNIYERDRLAQEVRFYREAKDKLAKLAADAATADALEIQSKELENRAVELESSLDTLTAEIAALEGETAQVTELKDKVSILLRFEQMKQQIPAAKQFVESTGEVIAQLGTDLDGLSKAANSINDRLNELALLTINKGSLYSKKRDIEVQNMNLEAIISKLNQQIGTINAKLQAIAGKKVGLTEKQEQLKHAAKQAAQLEILSQAFSQDGIPYQIIRDIVPELEAAANEILGQMTGGRMRLEFVTEKVLKSNKAKEVATLEIIISDVDNGVLPYLSRSGGQKVRAALANSFALAMIKASRVGLQLGMLFIDEPSFLDADGIEGYCTALETIHSKYPDMRILAISHDENMKSRFPQQLFVEMAENGSKVRRV